jgi:hypothetical protein
VKRNSSHPRVRLTLCEWVPPLEIRTNRMCKVFTVFLNHSNRWKDLSKRTVGGFPSRISDGLVLLTVSCKSAIAKLSVS